MDKDFLYQVCERKIPKMNSEPGTYPTNSERFVSPAGARDMKGACYGAFPTTQLAGAFQKRIMELDMWENKFGIWNTEKKRWE
jgi:hypothetical protein